MLHISVLGSGSGGNSAVVYTDQTRLLIDAGLSARQLNRRLEAIGVDPASLDGVLITHEHGDHVRGLDVFCRTVKVPLYANASTREIMITGPLKQPKTWRIVPTGGKFMIGDIQVQTFPVAHDATEPMGFALRDEDSAIGVLSDVGYVTNLMRNHMRGMNTIFVEANYDGVLLQNDLKRPWSVKQRILSRHGHLSNEQTAALLGDVADENLCRVILGHLSADCNDPQFAIDAVKEAIRAKGHVKVSVLCATQGEPTPCFPAIRGATPVLSISPTPGPLPSPTPAVPTTSPAPSTPEEDRVREPALAYAANTDYTQAELF
ncbi:MAG: phosphoribosyl 1,2-cyclic phosphodiesterase [Verrucomicrobiales bacterium]|jgi:phosphoribosyl 1,2-cyclic phosphodiesterase